MDLQYMEPSNYYENHSTYVYVNISFKQNCRLNFSFDFIYVTC